MRANLEKCKQYVQECSVLTNSKSLNRPARRFAKGEIYDSNLCDLLFFDYVDMPGHDALFNDPTVNDLKLSFKTEKNPIAPRKGVVEVTLSNPTGKSIENKSGSDCEFDYLVLTQTSGNCALLVCDKATAIKFQTPTSDQIKVSIPLDEVFWIIHPNDKVTIDCVVDESKIEEVFEAFRNNLIMLARKTIEDHKVGSIIEEKKETTNEETKVY
jgi:hypothetical protein